jgi:hypothetical protein
VALRWVILSSLLWGRPIAGQYSDPPSQCAMRGYEALRPDYTNVCPVGIKESVLASSEADSVPRWTHAPECIPKTASKNQHCVYTAANYNNDKGISFLIRPEAVGPMMDVIRDPEPARAARKYLARLGTKMEEEDGGATLPYEIRDIPGRGKSVVATRLIRRYDVFMVGFPAVMIDQELRNTTELMALEDLQRLHGVAFGRLPDQERVMSLAASTGGNVFQDIMRTNAFGVEVAKREYSGLYPEIAVSLRVESL